VITNYRARTDVERWQIQDRLAVRLRALGISAPAFYERAGGRLAFKIPGRRRLPAEVLDRLTAIDAAADTENDPAG
jgi:hypothetical protein